MLRVAYAALAVLALAACAAPVVGFWESGHMIVAEVARQTLQTSGEGRAALAKAESFARYMHAQGFPKNPDFVQLACWPDDIKPYSYAMNPFHFWNKPVPEPADFKWATMDCPLSKQSSVDLITGFGRTITTASDPKSTLGAGGVNNYWASWGLALFVHVMGDMHQPLHNTELYDVQFPKGDLGGNLIKVSWNNSKDITELHAFFDSVCGLYTGTLPRPLSASDAAWMQSEAASLIKQYPLSEAEASLLDPFLIANESWELGVKVAYHMVNGSLIQNHAVLDDAYTQRCIPVMQRQIVRGGVRIARKLITIMQNASAATAFGGSGDNSGSSNSAGMFIGGLVLGLGLCAIAFVVWKYVLHGGAAAQHHTSSSSPTAGYGAVQKEDNALPTAAV